MTDHQDAKIELLCHLGCTTKELTKNLLTLRKLTTTTVIGSVQRHDTIDDEKTVFVCGEVGSKTLQQLGLHLTDVSDGRLMGRSVN